MSDENIPVVVTGPAEESSQDDILEMLGAGIPDINFADDDATVKFFREHLHDLMLQTRNDRQNLEEEWRAIDNMEMLRHDDGQRYNGRSNVYMPMFNRSLATLTSNLIQGLFPSDEYMDVSSDSPEQLDAAKVVKKYLQWEFDHVAHVRQRIKPGMRQLNKYGNAPFKYWYQKRIDKKGKLSRRQLLDQSFATEFSYEDVMCEGFRVSARSLYHVYVFPSTAADMSEASMVFEDIEVPRQFIEDKAGRWKNIDQALHQSRDTQFDLNQLSRMEAAGLSQQPYSQVSDDSPQSLRIISEVWTRMPVPSKLYRGGERPGSFVPVKLIVCGDVILEAKRNPLWTQEAPYLWARTNTKPGLFYGDGFGRLSRGLQYLLNDFTNQTNDCAIYNLNPILKVNPAAIVGPLPKIRPGATWKMTDMNATGFERPPWEMLQYGMQMITATMGFGESFGGAPPVLQGSRGAKTATASQILQKNASMPLQDIIEDIELDVMVPMLRAAWSLAQQYRPDQIMIAVAGRPLRVPKEQLAIDASFKWLASSQAANQMARAQQVMQMLQVVGQIMPLLQMNGYQVNPVPLLQKLYSDAFGFRDFNQFIMRAPPMGPPGMQGGPPGQPGQPPGARPRSALEQVPGVGAEGVEMAPGEGEDFMDVRMGADQMAAMMGGMGGEFE